MNYSEFAQKIKKDFFLFCENYLGENFIPTIFTTSNGEIICLMYSDLFQLIDKPYSLAAEYNSFLLTGMDYDDFSSISIQSYLEPIHSRNKIDIDNKIKDVIHKFPYKSIIFESSIIKDFSNFFDIPSCKRGDFICFFRFQLELPTRTIYCAVTNALLDSWSMTQQDLTYYANQNTPLLCNYSIDKLENYDFPTFYAIKSTNEQNIITSLYCDANPLKDLAQELQDNLYVFPLSLKELIVFTETGGIDNNEFYEILDNHSFLLNDIYYYHYKSNKLALSKEERLELLEIESNTLLDPGERKNILGKDSLLYGKNHL